jgi:methyl-accepting chemotaxis protein
LLFLALVIAAKGQGTQRDKLNNQRNVADQAYRNLVEFKPESLDMVLVRDLLRAVQNELDNRQNIRTQVDRLAIVASPFAYYSNVNTLSLDNLSMLLTQISNRDLKQELQGLLSLLVVKEQAGKARGALNGAFAGKRSSLDQYAQVSSYIDAERYALRQANMLLEGDAKRRISETAQTNTWQQVMTIQQQYLSQKNTLSSIQGPTASVWFDLATQRIGLVKGLRDSLTADILLKAQANRDNASFVRLLYISLSVLVILPLILLTMQSVIKLRRRVSGFTQKLDIMARNKDLTVRLSDDQSDEIGEIARHFDGLAISLSDTLAKSLRVASQTQKEMVAMVALVDTARTVSEQTHQRCDSIAAAMTEMAQTSDQVAGITGEAQTSTDLVKTNAMACYDQGEHACLIVLIKLMSALKG